MLQIPHEKLYLYFDGQNQGPFDINEVRKLFKFQIINRTTPLWYEGLRNWVAVGDIPEFNRRSVPIAPEAPKTSPIKKSELWVYYSGTVSSMDLEKIKDLVVTQKLRRSDYIYQSETNEWVRGDQHTVTYKLFASPTAIESTPGINRTSLKTLPEEPAPEEEEAATESEQIKLGFVEKIVFTIQENLFLDILVLFLITLGVVAYLFWPKPSILEAPDLTEASEPMLNTKEQKPTKAQAKDQTLLGFDMGLRLSEFKIRHSAQISGCRDGKFAPPNASQFPEIVICEIKGGGIAHFYDQMLYSFVQPVSPTTKVSLKKAADQLREKTGYTTEVETFTEGSKIYCGASVPFHEGQALLSSEEISQKLIELYGGDRNSCDATVFGQVQLRAVEYKNPSVRKKLEAATRGEAKRQNATKEEDFSL